MMRLALAASILVMSTSFALRVSTTAHACSCGGWPASASEAKAAIDQMELAVIAHPAGYTSDEPRAHLIMNVTRVLHGPDVETITMPNTRETVESGQAGQLGPETRGEDCSYDIFGREDDLYFLNLTKNAKGEWETSSCAGSSALATLSQEGILQPIGLALIDQFGPDALEPSGPLAESSDKDLPIAIILPLAFLVPIGVLLVFSLIKPKGGGY